MDGRDESKREREKEKENGIGSNFQKKSRMMRAGEGIRVAKRREKKEKEE